LEVVRQSRERSMRCGYLFRWRGWGGRRMMQA
jgi:hypothetical protein